MSTLAASRRSSCIMQPSWVTHWRTPFTTGGRHQRKVSLARTTEAESVGGTLMVTLYMVVTMHGATYVEHLSQTGFAMFLKTVCINRMFHLSKRVFVRVVWNSKVLLQIFIPIMP